MTHANLGPSTAERLTRARGDLRMGVPVVLAKAGEAALVRGGRSADARRVWPICARIGQPQLALTQRRAETLKTAAYDGDLVRIGGAGRCGAGLAARHGRSGG